MAAAKWNVRTVAAEEDYELFNRVWVVIRGITGSKENGGFTADDAWLFTPDQQREMYHAAVRYACTYRGDFSHMVKMREHSLKSLPSDGQMWSIVNCMKADFRRRCADKRAALQSAALAPVAHVVEPKEERLYGTPVAPAPTVTRKENGYYTVNMGDGSHVTLRIDDDFRENAPQGSQIAAFLSGSDNTSDYTSFAFVTGGRVATWKRFREGFARQHAALDILLGADSDAAKAYGMAYAVESGRCARCGRLLTVEASVNRGLGPECAKKGWN